MKAEEILEKARIRLATEDCPFWAVLMFNLPFKEENGPLTMGTASTDGKNIYWNRKYVESLSVDECEFIIAHEVGIHVGLLHHVRLAELKRLIGNRYDHRIANKAVDYAGNQLLIDARVGKPPKGILYDPRFNGMSLEQIYYTIEKEENEKKQQESEESEEEKESEDGEENEQGEDTKEEEEEGDSEEEDEENDEDDGDESGQDEDESNEEEENKEGQGEGEPQEGDDPGMCGGVLPMPEGEDFEEEVEKIKTAISQALHAAEKAGTMPGGLRREIKGLLEVKADWKALLRNYVERHDYNDYSWERPNRAFIASGMYLPELHSTELGNVIAGVDWSGSVNEEQAMNFLTQCVGITSSFPNSALQVILFDDKAKDPVEITDESDLQNLDTSDLGGGTDYRPLFEKIEERQLEPACIVILTDGYCSSFPSMCDYPVLWVIDNDRRFEPPFGDVVKMI